MTVVDELGAARRYELLILAACAEYMVAAAESGDETARGLAFLVKDAVHRNPQPAFTARVSSNASTTALGT